ncbi:MAG: ATP-grasp domain-containing protein [Planctomycetota bacterium]
MSAILLVGWRPEAIEAARALGLEPRVLEPGRPGEVPARREEAILRAAADPDSPEDILRAGAALTGDGAVVAVVALTEGAVPVAARVRTALGLPGVTPETAEWSHEKLAMKIRIASAGIPCAPFEEIGSDTRADELVARLGVPVVVKQRASSGGRGTVVAHDVISLGAALRPGWLAEGFVRGVEMSVETFVVDGEIVFLNPTEYLVPGVANIVPAPLDAERLAALRAFVDRVHRALGIERGMTHTELFVGEDGLVFGEIAIRPPGGLLMALIGRVYGFDAWRALLEVEMGRRPALPETPHGAAGVWFLHPGAGRVATVEGLEAAAAMPGVVEVRCGLIPGRRVRERIGTGQSVGRVVAVGADRDEVAARLLPAVDSIRIELAH